MEEESGLVGKLNASIGEIIILSNSDEGIEISGYAVRLGRDKVRLSHENPFSKSA